MSLEYINQINAIYTLINNLFNKHFHKNAPRCLKIKLVNDVKLARTMFNQIGMPLEMEINIKLLNEKLNGLLILVLLHEIAHIETELLYTGSNHNENYKNICEENNIPYYEKIPLSALEMKLLEV